MSVSVVIAHREFGDGRRTRLFEWIDARWRSWLPDAEHVRIHETTTGEFTKARGLNEGVRAATGDIIVHVDPDSIVNLSNVKTAIELASDADGLVVPFDRHYYLTEEATDHLLGDEESGPGTVNLDVAENVEYAGPGGVGNCTVYSRMTWAKVGGYDERFGLWAGDDAAFAMACGVLVGEQRRLTGAAVHLWHERHPDSVVGSAGYLAQMSILEEYRDAPDADAMLAVIAGRVS